MDFDFDYAREVINSEAGAIKSLARVVDDSFAAAAELIYNMTGSVIVTGIGKAGIIGKKISATLASTGTPSHFLHPAEAVHGDLGRVQENDVVVALSYSGESDEIIRLIDPIKQRQIKLVAITGDVDSRLARHSDIVLCIGELTEACPLGIAPSVSTTCMLALGDAIASAARVSSETRLQSAVMICEVLDLSNPFGSFVMARRRSASVIIPASCPSSSTTITAPRRFRSWVSASICFIVSSVRAMGSCSPC